MKKSAIIQARMGSTRLSGKIMLNLQGKTVLSHVIERVSQAKLVDEVIIATTTNDRDEVIVDEALRNGALVFRGSEEDVLARYYFTAKTNNTDIILRITSDCPLIDPQVVDKMLEIYCGNNYDIVSNSNIYPENRTFPRGFDTEIFSFGKLEHAFVNAKEHYQREHVTQYIYEASEKVFYYRNDVDYSKYRLTLDTDADFELISALYDRLYHGKHDFYLKEIIETLEKEPDLYYINAHIEQKKVK